MKILVLNGSPKTKSDTFRLTEAFLRGMNKDHRHEVHVVRVINKQIAPCRGCFGCWAQKDGHCVIPDDQNEILDLYRSADVILWSFPLYCYGMPSHLKAVLDRTIPLIQRRMVQQSDGTVRHVPLTDFSRIHTLVICGCGFPDWDGNFDALRAMCRACFREPDMVFVPDLSSALEDKFMEIKTLAMIGDVYVIDIPENRPFDQYPRSVAKRAEEYGVEIAELVTGNATRLNMALRDRTFDAIFIDAPCSGLGTLRRHHEIRWRITREHIDELADTGLAMLKSAAEHVNPGGQIVYSTCTVTYAENNGVVKRFLESEEGSSFELAPFAGKACFVSQLSGDSCDAHFACRFLKRA